MCLGSAAICRMKSLSRNLFANALVVLLKLYAEGQLEEQAYALDVRKVLQDFSPRIAAGRIPMLEWLSMTFSLKKEGMWWENKLQSQKPNWIGFIRKYCFQALVPVSDLKLDSGNKFRPHWWLVQFLLFGCSEPTPLFVTSYSKDERAEDFESLCLPIHKCKRSAFKKHSNLLYALLSRFSNYFASITRKQWHETMIFLFS